MAAAVMTAVNKLGEDGVQQTTELLQKTATSLSTVYNELKLLAETLAAREKAAEEAERRLQFEQRTLKADKAQFEQEKLSVRDLSAQIDDSVIISAGGKLFTTSRRTLCTFKDSMLAAWFSGRHTLRKTENNEIILETDADVFAAVLEFCKAPDKIPDYPQDEDFLARLRQAFDYFCLPWPFLAEASLARVFATGHIESTHLPTKAPMFAVEITPTHIVAGGGGVISVRMWDHNGRRLHTLSGHTKPISSVSLFGNRIASGSHDRFVRIWDLTTGKSLCSIESEGPVKCVGLVGDTVCGVVRTPNSYNHSLCAWDVASREVLWQTQGVGGGMKGRLQFVDGVAGHMVAYVANSEEQAHLLLADFRTGQIVQTIPTPFKEVEGFEIDPPGLTLWTPPQNNEGDRHVWVWDLSRETCTLQTTVRTGFSLLARAVRGSFVWQEKNGDVVVVELKAGGKKVVLTGHKGKVNAFSVCGELAVTAGTDDCVRIWKVVRKDSKDPK